MRFHRSPQLSVLLFQLGNGNSSAQQNQNVEEPGASWIHQQVFDDEFGSGEKSSRAQEEGSAGDVARNYRFDRAQGLPALDPRLVSRLGHFAPKARKRDFAMIAGMYRLSY